MLGNVQIVLLITIGILLLITLSVSLWLRTQQRREMPDYKSAPQSSYPETTVAAERDRYSDDIRVFDDFSEAEIVRVEKPQTARQQADKSQIQNSPSLKAERHFSIEPGLKADRSFAIDTDIEAEIEVSSGVDDEYEELPALNRSQKDEPSIDEPVGSKLIVLYVMAEPGQKFGGYDLLQSLLAAGLRYGEMKIFHRHQQASGQGKRLFSLASASEPGTFDMSKMGGFATRGLTLFMQLTGSEHNPMAFNLLIDTAKQLAEELSGKVMVAGNKQLTDIAISQFKQIVNAHMASRPE